MIKIEKFNKDIIWFTNLIDECFSIKVKNKQGLVKWKFFNNINNSKNKIICWYDGNKIISQYSNIYFNFIKNKKTIDWYLCQDMCVSKKYRGQWLISEMFKKLYSEIEEKTLTIWFSNSSWVKVDKNSNWYWYNIIDNLVNYYFSSVIFKKWYSFEKIENSANLENIDFSKFNFFEDKLQINKTKEFIKWRYFNDSDYNFYVFKFNDEIIGYWVFKHTKTISTLFDFNCIKNIDEKKLVNTFKNISFKNYNLIFRIIILENNFWKKLFVWFFKISKNTQIYFTIKKHNNFDKLNVLDREEWKIMWGDVL